MEVITSQLDFANKTSLFRPPAPIFHLHYRVLLLVYLVYFPPNLSLNLDKYISRKYMILCLCFLKNESYCLLIMNLGFSVENYPGLKHDRSILYLEILFLFHNELYSNLAVLPVKFISFFELLLTL